MFIVSKKMPKSNMNISKLTFQAALELQLKSVARFFNSFLVDISFLKIEVSSQFLESNWAILFFFVQIFSNLFCSQRNVVTFEGMVQKLKF